jgi:hypothetical protein
MQTQILYSTIILQELRVTIETQALVPSFTISNLYFAAAGINHKKIK